MKGDVKATVEKAKNTVQAVFAETKDVTKQGVQKAGEGAGNVAHHVQADLRKAGKVTTNALAKTKETVVITTNKVKEKVKEARR